MSAPRRPAAVPPDKGWPIWDFDLAFGNITDRGGNKTDIWSVEEEAKRSKIYSVAFPSS